MADQRIVYGACCSWWGSITETAKTNSGLPACPHCGGVLYECPDEATWWDGAHEYERRGANGYVAFLEWSRGRCFPNIDAARAAYAEASA